MNHENQNYFDDLKNIIQKFSINFIFTIPNIFKIKERVDKIKKKKVYIPFFRKDILIQDYNKCKSSEIFFISHYLGNIDHDDYDFYDV